MAHTIRSLEKALAQAKSDARSSVSCSKYMALVDKKKLLATKCSELEKEVEAVKKLKEDNLRLDKQCAELRVMDDVLRQQVVAAQD